MNEHTAKIVYCVIRTAGLLGALALSVWAAKVLELGYEDLRTILGMFNAYFPEFVALVMFAMVGLIFYRASVNDENEFNFVNFFVAGKSEDIWRLGYFVLLLCAAWSIFLLAWRDKLTPEYIGVVLTAFILKNIADTAGKAWGSNPAPTRPSEG